MKKEIKDRWLEFLQEARIHDRLCGLGDFEGKPQVPVSLARQRDDGLDASKKKLAADYIKKWDPTGTCCLTYKETGKVSISCAPKKAKTEQPKEKKKGLSGKVYTGRCYSQLKHDKTYQWGIQYLKTIGYLDRNLDYLNPTYDPTKSCPIEVFNAVTKYQNDNAPYKFTDLKDKNQTDGVIGWRTIKHMVDNYKNIQKNIDKTPPAERPQKAKELVKKSGPIKKETGLSPVVSRPAPNTKSISRIFGSFGVEGRDYFKDDKSKDPRAIKGPGVTKMKKRWKWVTFGPTTQTKNKGTYIHKKLAAAFEQTLAAAYQATGYKPSRLWSANARKMRPGKGAPISYHSYGIAFDVDHHLSPRGTIKGPLVETEAGRLWAKHWVDAGWDWGILWGNPDTMHFEYTNRGRTWEDYEKLLARYPIKKRSSV